jgi:hypothetical protein
VHTTNPLSGQPDNLSGHRLPGVRYITETRQRPVTHYVDGQPEEIDEDYDVLVPVPPRDWDRIVFTGVTCVAITFTLVSVAWSAVSGGDLLATTTSGYFAYPAALGFDLAWLTCQALEWLYRYDPDRAQLPRRAGYAFLAIAMAVIVAHGTTQGQLVAGIAGATVSLIAKGLWMLVIRHHARPLPELTRRWLLKREGDIAARLALSGQLRTLARAEAQASVYAAPARTAITTDTTDTHPDTGTDMSARASATVRSAVRAAASALPDATVTDIVDRLSLLGVDTDTDTVRTILDADTDTTDTRSQPRTHTNAPHGSSVADSVRTAVASGLTNTDAVLSYVRKIHGQTVPRDTVARTLRRTLPARQDTL